jgi:hypothetical protein
MSATFLGGLPPPSAGTTTSNRWGFQVDLPANEPGLAGNGRSVDALLLNSDTSYSRSSEVVRRVSNRRRSSCVGRIMVDRRILHRC